MGWPAYVRAIGGDVNSDIARRVGISQPSVSRWFGGTIPDPTTAARFARAYGRPVLEAFLAAGFLTLEDAGETPSVPPSLATLGDDDLLDEVRRRMARGTHERDETNGDTPAAAKKMPSADDAVTIAARHSEDRLIAALEDEMAREGLSVAQLASRLGWSADELGDRLEGRAEFQVREYLAVCDALGLDAFSVSLTLGLSDEVPEGELGVVRVEDRRE